MIETLSTAVAVLVAVELSALIALHRSPTGCSPLHDAVSDYGVGRYRGLFWLHLITGALACLSLAFALSHLDRSPTQAVVALVATAGARLLLPFFASDRGDDRSQTAHGTVHILLAVVSFGGLVWASSFLGSTLSWVMLGSVAVLVALRRRRLAPWFGLFERLFYVASFAWLFSVAIDHASTSPSTSSTLVGGLAVGVVVLSGVFHAVATHDGTASAAVRA